MASLVSSLVVQMSAFSYVGYMVQYLGVVDDKNKAGYYAGLLSSAVMIGRLFSSIFWGQVADRLGCRSVMVVGLLSTAGLSLGFGISTTFTWAFVCRFLLGLLNGVTAASKTLVSQVCGTEHETVGMGVITTSWSIGAVLGPGIGGLLADPAKHHPLIFSKIGVFGTHPYLLPNVIGAGLALLALPLVLAFLNHDDDAENIAQTVLKVATSSQVDGNGMQSSGSNTRSPSLRSATDLNGTLPTSARSTKNGFSWRLTTVFVRGCEGPTMRLRGVSSSPVWCESCRTDGDEHENDGDGAIYMPAKTSTSVLPQSSLSTANPPPRNTETSLLIGARNELSDVSGNPGRQTGDAKRSSLLPQRHIRILLLIEALYSFEYTGFDEVFSLWSLSTSDKGGLDWTSQHIGQVFVACGLMVLVYEIFAVPNITPRLGVRMSQRVGSVFMLLVYFLLPPLSNANNAGTHVTIITVILLFTSYVGSNMFYIGVALALNNAAEPDRRGELNGISAAGSSLARAISPMICSVLFAFSIDGDHPFPFDYHFAFYLLATLRLAVACMAWNRIKDTRGGENPNIEC
eukprot:jgi/Undpi1/10487/HiC_scaffold_29.g12937.m1